MTGWQAASLVYLAIGFGFTAWWLPEAAESARAVLPRWSAAWWFCALVAGPLFTVLWLPLCCLPGSTRDD